MKSIGQADTLYISWNNILDVCTSTIQWLSQLYRYTESMLFRPWLFKDTVIYCRVKIPTIRVEQGSPPACCRAKTSWTASMKPPVSRKEVFCCQKEEVTLWVPFYFQKQATCQYTMLWHADSNIRPKPGVLQVGRFPTRVFHLVSNWDICYDWVSTTRALNCLIMGSHCLELHI